MSSEDGTTRKRKRSFTNQKKIKYLEELQESGLSIRKFAAQNKLDESVIRRWKGQLPRLKKSKKTARRVDGGGRHSIFPELEAKLYSWILSRNKQGLRVKMKYIRNYALVLRDEMINEKMFIPEQLKALTELQHFTGSTGWYSRFVKRYNLGSRRQTSTRTLPVDFMTQSRDFLSKVQSIIESNHIQLGNIVNLDQVPRYFECESSTTITKKGSKNVVTKKASTSHKRFTMTPTITADGKVLAVHVLFSKLKKRPRVDERCLVDVNDTGMMNKECLKRLINDVIIDKVQGTTCEPILILLDAYGTHIKFVDNHEEKYKRRNVFFAIIPGSLTGILQPLDVSINRSFQQFYSDKYNDYLSEAVTNEKMQTKSGNIVMPKYTAVSQWVADWSENLNPETITNAFVTCGLVPSNMFDIQKFHKPLRDCYEEDVNFQEWCVRHATSLRNQDYFYPEGWLIFEGVNCLPNAIYSFLQVDEDFDEWFKQFSENVIEEILLNETLNELFDSEENRQILHGLPTESKMEFSVISALFNIDLELKQFDNLFNIIEENLFMAPRDDDDQEPKKKLSMLCIYPSIVGIQIEKVDTESESEDDTNNNDL